ncbi:MAG: hypothetical protein ACK4LQ_12770 [Pararhodobacter sp.]
MPSAALPTNEDAARLDALRHLFRLSRARARLDPFEACAMLATAPSRAAPASAEALLRALEASLGRALVLYRPGEAMLSFDERWLLGLLDAAQRDDTDSMAFLLLRRLPHHACRQIGWLARQVMQRLARFGAGAS